MSLVSVTSLALSSSFFGRLVLAVVMVLVCLRVFLDCCWRTPGGICTDAVEDADAVLDLDSSLADPVDVAEGKTVPCVTPALDWVWPVICSACDWVDDLLLELFFFCDAGFFPTAPVASFRFFEED
jgi:hypothetical protein